MEAPPGDGDRQASRSWPTLAGPMTFSNALACEWRTSLPPCSHGVDTASGATSTVSAVLARRRWVPGRAETGTPTGTENRPLASAVAEAMAAPSKAILIVAPAGQR